MKNFIFRALIFLMAVAPQSALAIDVKCSLVKAKSIKLVNGRNTTKTDKVLREFLFSNFENPDDIRVKLFTNGNEKSTLGTKVARNNDDRLTLTSLAGETTFVFSLQKSSSIMSFTIFTENSSNTPVTISGSGSCQTVSNN